MRNYKKKAMFESEKVIFFKPGNNQQPKQSSGNQIPLNILREVYGFGNYVKKTARVEDDKHFSAWGKKAENTK